MKIQKIKYLDIISYASVDVVNIGVALTLFVAIFSVSSTIIPGATSIGVTEREL